MSTHRLTGSQTPSPHVPAAGLTPHQHPASTLTVVSWPGSAAPPPLRFALPAGFHPLPLPDDASPSPYEERLAALVAAVYPGGEPAWHARVADGYRTVGEAYVRRGLRYAAVGFFAPEPDGDVTHASVTVAATPSDHPSPAAAVAGLVEVLSRDVYADVEPATLPCGPAAIAVRRELTTLDVPAPSGPRRIPLVTGHVQLHLPSPSAPWVYALDMATPSLAHWPRFAVLAANLADSLTL